MKFNIKTLVAFLAVFTLVVVACSNSDQNIIPPGPDKEETEEPENPEETNNKAVVNYLESMEVFNNPERGFYTYKKYEAGKDENKPLTSDEVSKHREDNISLIFITHLMREFMEKPISDAYLQMIRKNFQALRDGGSKSIIRFCYSDRQATAEEEENGTFPYDPKWEIMQGHINQLKPIFEEYVDVISAMEAGFIGAWGEWYYTTNYIYQPKDDEYEPRKQVLEALLDAMPKERMIAVRYPKAKLMIYGINHTDSITINEAYNQSNLARVAAHNDCVFADQDDRGTFGGNRNYRAYWASESRYYVMGGETCRFSEYATCENALPALKEYHWSYLNINYTAAVLDHWRQSGCFEDVERNLGYRFVLLDGEFDKKVKEKENYKMTVNLMNVGYAAPYNERKAELIIASETDANLKHIVKLDEDPRHWFTDIKVELSLDVKLPDTFKSGRYSVYLNLPDPKENLASNSNFSIRLANENTWEEGTGYNKLYTFEVE